jgi:hypothetical protein
MHRFPLPAFPQVFLSMFLLSSVLAITPAANSTTIFADDFSLVPISRGLVPSAPLGWRIDNTGSVEILGQCGNFAAEDLLPGNNCYIDLDGNLGDEPSENFSPPGLLTTSLPLKFGYSYNLKFDLAGNQVVPFGDGVHVSFGSESHYIYKEPFEGFATLTYTFSPPSSGEYALSFINTNDDAYGALLDNVIVTEINGPVADVPVPPPLLGAAAAFGFSRRLRARLRSLRR